MKSIEHYEQLAREARSECRHENADHLMPGHMVSAWFGCPIAGHVPLVEQFRCLDCGAWLSLGPSRDSIPRCEHLLAAALATIHRLWEPGESRDEAIAIAVDDCAGES